MIFTRIRLKRYAEIPLYIINFVRAMPTVNRKIDGVSVAQGGSDRDAAIRESCKPHLLAI